MLTDFRKELELADGLETKYLKILFYDLSQNYKGIYKTYEYTRLCTIIEGKKNISINDGSEFSYEKNQFILMPPQSNVQMNIAVPTKALVYELNSDLLKNVTDKICIDYEVDFNSLIADKLFLGQMNPATKDNLNKIMNIQTKADKNVEFLLDLYAQELVYNLIQIKGVQQILDLEYENPVNKALKYMNDNYKLPISIKLLAYDLNMSESTFCQYFKKVTGITPKEYLTDIKLSKAKDMIKRTSVTDAAFDLGYENISHFISLFKNKYGITPKQYQKTSE